MPYQSINPTSGEELQRFASLNWDDVDCKLAHAQDAFRVHRKTIFDQRSAGMHRLADILVERIDELSRIMTVEVGKPIGASRDEVEKCARCCHFYADHAAQFLADQPLPMDTGIAFVRHQPLGPVLAIMPWNFPLWQVIRFAAPAIMAGNVVLLKHAENVPQCAFALESAVHDAGFPAGVFQVLLVETEMIARVLDDPRIAAATLTGSERAGRAVGEQAGRNIKKVVLELGGSDPFVIMPSADLDKAIPAAVTARTLNNGQSCIAAKRFIVADPIYDTVVERLTADMAKRVVGDPMAPGTDIGPLAMSRLRDVLHRQVTESVNAGAQCLLGGHPLNGPGYFYPPTVLTDINPGCPAYHEELFGPVALMFRARDRDNAIRIANDTPFGLGSSVWTRDDGDVQAFVDEIEAGMVYVNSMVASDPRLPFGGIKQSGIGRELSSLGILEFTNQKTICIGV